MRSKWQSVRMAVTGCTDVDGGDQTGDGNRELGSATSFFIEGSGQTSASAGWKELEDRNCSRQRQPFEDVLL